MGARRRCLCAGDSGGGGGGISCAIRLADTTLAAFESLTLVHGLGGSGGPSLGNAGATGLGGHVMSY